MLKAPSPADYSQTQHSKKKVLWALSAVALFHLLLLWLMSSGLGKKLSKAVSQPVQAVLLEELKPPPPPPPLPPPPPPAAPAPPAADKKPPPSASTPPAPAPTPTPAYVPPADTPAAAAAPSAVAAVSNAPAPVAAPAPAAPAAPPAPTALPAPPAPPAPAKPAVKTAAVANASQCVKPEYPPASERNEEEGTVTLRMLVGANGKVIKADITKSSGFKRLDEAARAALSRCTFKPATSDGVPEEGYAVLQYEWKLLRD